MTYFPKTTVEAADSASIDAFSRWRTSNPVSLFDSSFQWDLNPLLFATSTASSASISHYPNYSSAQMTVVASTGSNAILMTKQFFRYQPGKSQLVFITQVPGVATAGVRKRIGYFGDNDGIFLEQNGNTDLAIVRRTSTSGASADTRVTQANWNIDTMNGSGASGINLDMSKATILVIDLQWLGMGRVRVGFDVDGSLYYAHEFLNANNLTSPYMKTANLPVRWEMYNTTGASAATMYATCCSVNSEGGFETERGYTFATASPTDITVANGSRTLLFSTRVASAFNGISPGGIYVIPDQVTFYTGASPILVEVIYSGAASGGTWSSVNSAVSTMEVNHTAVWASGGIVVDAYVLPGSTVQSKTGGTRDVGARLPVVRDPLTGEPYLYNIVATGLGGTSACRAALSWKEIR